MLADTFAAAPVVDDSADAHQAVVEWDAPEPAVLVGLDKDVASIGSRETLGTFVVCVDREVLEVGVVFAEAKLADDEAGLSAGIDEKTRGQGEFAVSVGDADVHRVLAAKLDVEDAMLLADINPGCGRVLEEDLVEPWAPDLVGVGMRLVRLAEMPAPAFVPGAPDHGGAVLLGEAFRSDSVEDAEFFKDGEGGGEKRFADVIAWKAITFEENHFPAHASEHGGG